MYALQRELFACLLTFHPGTRSSAAPSSSHKIEKTSALPASPGSPITPTIGYAPGADETALISPYQHHHSPHLTTKHALIGLSHTHS